MADEPVTWPTERLRTTTGVLMSFVVDRVDTPDGKQMVRNYLEHPDAIGIIALDDKGRIVVERQYRHPVRRKLIEAPAGLCDQPGEALLHAAQRELAEEVGLAAADWRILCDVYATPGCATQATRVFLAQGLAPVPAPDGFVLEAEEADMAVGWADLDDLVEAIKAGRVMNPTIWSPGTGVQHFASLTSRTLSSIIQYARKDTRRESHAGKIWKA